ncbi:transmembrane 7 superfamily member 3-like [Anticarsia gemmatalis]|uniref:transmembrane 7 superfamily member 3-like n=1 Tax=Anticarsia gemmatalis TaxID=129554 RepID=UPI003F771FF3
MLSKFGAKLNLGFLFLLFNCALVTSQDANENTVITIPLNSTIVFDDREIYSSYLLLKNYSTVQVKFTNINPDLYFIVFQVHSHYHDVVLYKNNMTNENQVTGTNVGQVTLTESLDTYYIQNPNVNATFRVYISVHGYKSYDPFPGGCNMEFSLAIAPYLIVNTNAAYISVNAAPPSTDKSCNIVNDANTSFYYMYLPEQTFSEDDYFRGIRRMMTLKNIQKYGELIPTSAWRMRRLLSAYPGNGVIFVVVARTKENGLNYSIYVPNHSYGCPVSQLDENGCVFPEDLFSQMLCIVAFLVGLFATFFGHRFFKSGMFLAGFFSGFIITYILVTLMDSSINTEALVAASFLSGIFFGSIWLLFWWLYGIPVAAVLLPSLNLGFLLAAIFLYRIPASVVYLEEDLYFWTLFIMVMSLSALALVSVTYSANIICFAVLGGFSTVYIFDYHLGANLKYIIINTVRRAVVPTFNKVFLLPPFQWRELTVTLLWVLVSCLGWMFQHWHNRGRPPFPPPPRSTRPAAPGPAMYGAIIDHTNRGGVTRPAGSPGRTNERTSLLAHT